MSTFSHCPAWCDLPAGHGPHHSATVREYVTDADASVSVRVVSYANGRPKVLLLADGDDIGGVTLDAEKATSLAAVFAATGVDDVARALREASTVLEGAAS